MMIIIMIIIVLSTQLAMKATVQDVIGLVTQAFQDILYN